MQGHVFYNAQLMERSKFEKNYDFENGQTEVDLEMCTNDYHIIAKVYILLLKMETEDEQVKDCMGKIFWI